MIASLQELNELEAFFKTVKVPQTLTLKGGTYYDFPKFIEDNIDKLKKDVMVPVVARPRYHDLLVIKRELIVAAL